MSEAPAELPFGSESAQEAGEQQAAPGLSPRQHRVAALLTRLAATARSFLLYDPHNEAIQRFITRLLADLSGALEEEGPLTLRILPLEVVFEDAAVYVNRDRERSLAFRLYRDGVRQLRFRPGFGADELARLLEVLSIRYTGVNQREEDMVTLLWKSRFHNLEVVSVEGIVPEDDAAPVGSRTHAPAPASGLGLPDDVDLPRPPLPVPTAPAWVEVPPERLGELLAEAEPARVADEGLALLERLRRELDAPDARLVFADVAHLFAELRDFLLSEDHLPALKRFVGLLWRLADSPAPAWDPERHAALYELLDTCGDRRAVGRLLHSVPFDERRLNPVLVEVLDRACPDPLAAVLDALEWERGPAGRAVGRQLLEHYGARRLDRIEERFRGSTGDWASDLLRVLARIGGEQAPAFIARQASHPDKAVQDEALWHLEHMPYSGAVGRAFFEAFRVTDASRRARVLGMIAQSQDRRFVEVLAGFVEDQGDALSLGEAAQIGQVMGALGGEAALPLWAEWLTPSGVFRRALAGSRARQVAAALALSELQIATAGEALESAIEPADPEVQQWVLGALGQRERNRGER